VAPPLAHPRTTNCAGSSSRAPCPGTTVRSPALIADQFVCGPEHESSSLCVAFDFDRDVEKRNTILRFPGGGSRRRKSRSRTLMFTLWS